LASKTQGLIIAWRNEGVHVTTLVYSHLRDDMSGGAKPVDAESGAGPGHPIRAVPDQPGAQKRRRVVVVVLGWQRETEPGIRDGVFRVPTVDLVAREASAATQVLSASTTELTLAA
jgi:hypothetical protein